MNRLFLKRCTNWFVAVTLTTGMMFSGIAASAGTAPSTPFGLKLTEATGTGFKISWNAPSVSAKISKYEVFVNDEKFTESETNHFEFSGLDPARVYRVSVAACDVNERCSARSGRLFARTMDTIQPSQPTRLTASNITSVGFRLNWQPSTDNIAVKGYKVFMNDVEVVDHAKAHFHATGLTPNTNYAMKVVAYDEANNESLVSEVRNVKTLAIPAPPIDVVAPSIPRNLVTTDVTMTNFRVRWSFSTDASGIKEYEVYRNGVLAGKTADLAFYFAGLVPGSSHLIRLIAIDNAGNRSALSQVLNASTLVGHSLTEKSAPTVPTNVGSSDVTHNSFKVNWTASTDNVYVLGYNVYLNGKYVATVNNQSYTFSGLSSQTNYSVRILAFDVAKNRSPLTTAITVRTN